MSNFLQNSITPLYIWAEFNFSDELSKLNPFAENTENVDIYTLLTYVIQTALILSGLIAIAFTVIGGYQYITSGGNPEKTKKATSTITMSIIGLVLILAAALVVNFVVTSIIKK
ncbi:pilin [Patescibacteria group bacterium]|nr:pilin [Patescibacteria group bacterium]